MEKEDLTGIVIDGAVPRENWERIHIIRDFADTLANNRDAVQLHLRMHPAPEAMREKTQKRLWALNNEVLKQNATEYTRENYEFWHEIENDYIELINDLLPYPLVCVLGEVESGTVEVRERTEDER